jgi:hypothetical protein
MKKIYLADIPFWIDAPVSISGIIKLTNEKAYHQFDIPFHGDCWCRIMKDRNEETHRISPVGS